MVIGLHGKMGAGKNECARRLALLTEQPVVEVSFAAKIKESAAALLGVTVDVLERWKNDPSRMVCAGGLYDGLGFMPTHPLTVREFLQRYGTEAHRDVFGDGFWLDAALPIKGVPTGEVGATGAAILELGGYDDALYVVTDVRFQNEADRVRHVGGFVVAVMGPDADTGTHSSEQPLACDYAILNAARDDGFASLDERLGRLLDYVGLESLAA